MSTSSSRTSDSARRPLRVALDGRAFDAAAGGVRRYVTELVGAMRALPEVEMIAVGGRAIPPGLAHRPATASLPTNLGWCSTGLPLALRRMRVDVFHAPAYTGPLWGAEPLVLTIHDVSYARKPEWSPHPEGVGRVRRWFYQTAARRARRVITDSQFSRSEIIAAYSLDPERIDVAPLGVSGRFTADPRIAREMCVLHVGDLHARRNLDLLLDVVLALARSDSRLAGLRLVLAGRDLGLLPALRARVDAEGVPGILEYIGQPSDDDLATWYRRAGVFAYPSRYEGFGLPVLEAMASAAPVVASRAASIPEVTGDAARLVSPDDPKAWFDRLRSVLLDAPEAAALSERSRARAALFTWQRTAELTLDSYERAARIRQ